MTMSNKFYDIAKYVLLIIVPALNILLIGLGKLYGWNTEIVVGTISLFATFFGSILKISSDNYNRTKNKEE